MIILQTPKNFDLNNIPKNLKKDMKFNIGTDIYILTEIKNKNILLTKDCKSIEKSKKYFIIKKIVDL